MADGQVLIDSKLDSSGVTKGAQEIEKQFEKAAKAASRTAEIMERELKAVDLDGVADGMSESFEAEGRKVGKILEETSSEARETAGEISNTFEEAADNQSDAMAEAWDKTKKESASGSRKVIKDIDDIGDKAESVGDKITDGIGGAFKSLAATAVTYIGVEEITEAAVTAIQAAADIRAENAQFAQTFRDVEKTARNSLNAISKETGISASRMQKSYASIYAYLKSMGTETAEAMDIANRGMIAAADSAAYYDRTMEDTTETLLSFLKGNFENDAALGISAAATARNTKANEKYAKSFDRLAESQKVDTLLAMVEAGNELSGALGQAAREADSWANVTGELNESWRQFLGVFGEGLIDDTIPALQFLTAELNKYVALRNELNSKNSIADNMTETELAAESLAATVQQLRTEFDATWESAKESLDKQIGLFDELVIQNTNGAATIIANWKSQQGAFKQYEKNLTDAVNMGLDKALVEQLSDGSVQSMEILNSLVNSFGVSVDDINAAFQGVSESRETVAAVMADITSDMSSKLNELESTVSSEWGDMAGIVGAEIEAMQSYINSLEGKTVYIDLLTRIGGDRLHSFSGYSNMPLPPFSYEPSAYSLEPASYSFTPQIPYLATGAVIPPLSPFMAVLGDQSRGMNIEAPEDLIRKIVREEAGSAIEVSNTLEVNGDLAALVRLLHPKFTAEARRVGDSLAKKH